MVGNGILQDPLVHIFHLCCVCNNNKIELLSHVQLSALHLSHVEMNKNEIAATQKISRLILFDFYIFNA